MKYNKQSKKRLDIVDFLRFFRIFYKFSLILYYFSTLKTKERKIFLMNIGSHNLATLSSQFNKNYPHLTKRKSEKKSFIFLLFNFNHPSALPPTSPTSPSPNKQKPSSPPQNYYSKV